MLSKSGERPSFRARLWFIFMGIMIVFVTSNLLISTLTEGVIFPGVSVSGHDLSFKTRNQAREILKSIKTERSFTVKVGDKTFETNSSELGAKYDLDATLEMAYKVGHNSPLSVLGFLDSFKRGQLGYTYRVDSRELKAFTSRVVNSVGSNPVNAGLSVKDGNVEIYSDKDGLKIDEEILNRLIESSLGDGKDQNFLLEPKNIKAPLRAIDLGTAKQKAIRILDYTVSLNYDGKVYLPDRSTRGHWLVFNEAKSQNGSIILNVDLSREQIMGYLQTIANQVDEAPINKKINIKNGVSSVEREGQVGKAIDQAKAAGEIYSSLQKGNSSITVSSYDIAFITETNRSVTLDYGRYIEINISSQTLWAYQDNQVIFSTPITSGATGAGFPTVTGLFSIYAKERSRYLNGRPYGWDYNVYVDYWMPFYAGYGLHDADWRSAFGGQDYYYGGSHGCVNMPKASAAFLFGWADIGTPVWIHN